MFGRILAGCLVLTLVLPLLAQNAKKGAKDDKPAVDADKLKPGVFVGKLLNAPGTDGAFTVEVEMQTLELRPNAGAKAANQQVRLARDQIGMQKRMISLQKKAAKGTLNAADMASLQRAQATLMRHAAAGQAGGGASPYTVKTARQKVDFNAARDVKVRLLEPAQQFTDKGEIKKFTKAELEQMKGKERNLPGFEGTLADLRGGQIVRVTQARASMPANKDAEGPGADEAPHANLVKLIVILGTAPERPGDRKAKK